LETPSATATRGWRRVDRTGPAWSGAAVPLPVPELVAWSGLDLVQAGAVAAAAGPRAREGKRSSSAVLSRLGMLCRLSARSCCAEDLARLYIKLPFLPHGAWNRVLLQREREERAKGEGRWGGDGLVYAGLK
jgi:hypothetical protein